LTFTLKQSTTFEILPVPESDNIRSMSPESGHLRRNSVSPNFGDQTGRILAFISNSGYISRNPVKVARILMVSDGISSSMIFILFYINIYIF
jgi:hypothetical protein